MTDRYAVFGNPVAHSQSPWIHTRFAELTGQDLRYDRMEAPVGGFDQALRAFVADGGRGLNVTVPFKQDAWHAVDQRSQRATRAGAVNTIVVTEGDKLFGDNTDGVGLLRDLRDNHGLAVTGSRVLLLGAGGAVRGVLEPLTKAAPAGLVIANRTVERAQALLPLCGDIPTAACGFAELARMEPFDLVINGTSAGLSGSMPDLPPALFTEGAAAYDMVYGATRTVFMGWSRNAGAETVLDGLGMLVEQAAESFLLWRGVRPETSGVITALREKLTQG
ncbi:MAG: shikimate dehydrogenase [Aquisalimonadaceae bacterium]